MIKNLKNILSINIIKTLRINLRYLPFKEAIKCPILVSGKVNLNILKGEIIFKCPIKTGLVRFGFNTLGLVDYNRERAIFSNQGRIIFAGRCRLGAACRIGVLENGELHIGQNVALTGRSSIIAGEYIKIGDNCLISWDVQIMDTDFHKLIDSHNIPYNYKKPIIINEHVWIGCRSLILKGTIIPPNSVIAAGSIITGKQATTNAIYASSTIKIIKKDINWEK